MKTYTPKANDITREWHHIDASDQILGRLASDIAQKLIGKHKPYFAAHLDCGDYVVVTNIPEIEVTGTKKKDKVYFRHSGYPGGLKAETLNKKLDRDPKKVIELAVKGMLPKNKLRDKRMRRLKLFVDNNHPYADKFASKKEATEKKN